MKLKPYLFVNDIRSKDANNYLNECARRKVPNLIITSEPRSHLVSLQASILTKSIEAVLNKSLERPEVRCQIIDIISIYSFKHTSFDINAYGVTVFKLTFPSAEALAFALFKYLDTNEIINCRYQTI